MEYHRDHLYPNGWSKSRLYEVFLTSRDFGISTADYELNLEFVRIDEKNGEKNCAWYIDIDTRLVVAELQFLNRDTRLVITEQGFQFMKKPGTRNKLQVFISYAREDLESAKKLFEQLKIEGFAPWFDRECLKPGEPWETGIERAIRVSHYFIALLSSHSVAKRGYVQKEIRRGLEIREQAPDQEIFLIPARLDECQPNHLALEKLNWIDLFPNWETGLAKILDVIKSHPEFVAEQAPSEPDDT